MKTHTGLVRISISAVRAIIYIALESLASPANRARVKRLARKLTELYLEWSGIKDDLAYSRHREQIKSST